MTEAEPVAFTNRVTKEDLTRRLRRIEGQVRGVQKMIEADRDCQEILQQLVAIRAAVQQTSLQVVRSYATHCLSGAGGGDDQAALVEDLIKVLGKAA